MSAKNAKVKLPTGYTITTEDSADGWTLKIFAWTPGEPGDLDGTPVIGRWTERTYVTAFDALQGARRAVDDFEYALKTKEAA